MDAPAVEFQQGATKQNEQQLEQLQKQVEALYQNLRTVRHAINNNVAVIMAMTFRPVQQNQDVAVAAQSL